MVRSRTAFRFDGTIDHLFSGRSAHLRSLYPSSPRMGISGGPLGMNTKTILLGALALLLQSFALQAADSPFRISIVPERRDKHHATISWAEDNQRTFHVVFTNISKKNQAIFQPWNSWGYQNVSFEITAPNQKPLTVSMKPQIFTRNVPGTFLVPPGEQYVLPVTLNKQWEVTPAAQPFADGKRSWIEKVSIKARYQVKESKESKKRNVWAGQTESPALTVTINHW